jgi:polyketide cyclase/dehydrase/lipid transport protein
VKWIVWALAVVIALVILVTLIGWLLPKKHMVTRVGRYHQPPEAIWSAISNIDAMPSWREGVKSVKRLPDHEGLPSWVEMTGAGAIPLETVTSQAPAKLVVRIADRKLPFGGTWTYAITGAPEGSELRITEDGEVYNPIFRFMSRFVFGYSATIEGYLKSLAKKFGEAPRVAA